MRTQRFADGDGPSGATRVVGIIGDPVAHSLSPLLHNTAFGVLGMDWISVAFPVAEGSAGAALLGAKALGLAGLSVTMPHKSSISELVDECSPLARRLHSVNCVVRLPTGRFRGESTDGVGFLEALRRSGGIDPSGKRCMVEGAGGAARAVILALVDAGAAEVVVVNRTENHARTAASLAGRTGRIGIPQEADSMDLVVNATPAGMEGAGQSGTLPAIDPGVFGPGQVVMDLIYRPLVTTWLAEAKARGATIVGGLGMLVHQAGAIVELWTGEVAPVEEMWASVEPELSGEVPGAR